jgi:hypothetical protein
VAVETPENNGSGRGTALATGSPNGAVLLSGGSVSNVNSFLGFGGTGTLTISSVVW